MQTNDNEYFRSAVTDEWNTPRPLTEQEQADARKQQAFRTRRHSTARRAFSLAAPVAVVAVAATLVTTVAYALTPCPVCGKTQCNYYANGHRAQGLLETDLTRVETKRLTEENQFAYENLSFSGERGNLALSSYLTMENGSSVGISYEEVNQFLYDQGKPAKMTGSDKGETGTQLQYVGFHLTNYDGEDIYYHVLYLADGSTPAEHSIWDYGNVDESLKGLPYTYAEQKLGDDPLWLIAYSFSDQITAQEILPEIETVILPVPTEPVQVGFDLILIWNDRIKLVETQGLDDSFWGHSFDKADNGSESYALRQTPSSSYYLMKTDRGKSFRVRFAPYDWDQVQAAWTKLYEKAPATGHMGLSVSEPLQPVEVNGVTYHAYILLNRSTEDGEMVSDNLLFVPQNDPTSMIECPIHDVTTNDPASLAGSTVEEIVGENTDWQSVLSLFYPVGAEPNPFPTPTPSPTPAPTPEKEPEEPFAFKLYFVPDSGEDEVQAMNGNIVTELPRQLEEQGFNPAGFTGWWWGSYQEDYFLDAYTFRNWDETVLAYIEAVWLKDGSMPQESDRYGTDMEYYPADIDWSQAKSYAVRAAEGGYYIRVYSFLDGLTAQEILDNTTDSLSEGVQ